MIRHVIFRATVLTIFVSPASASSLATIPPPAPAPTTTALTCLNAIDPPLSRLTVCVSVLPYDLGIFQAYHLVAHIVSVAAVPRAAVKALHSMVSHHPEELLTGDLLPDIAWSLGVFQLL